MFEVRSQDGSAELGDVGNDEARSEFCPAYELGRFWINDHSRAGISESTTAIPMENSVLVELGDKVIGGDRFSAERAGLRQGLQRIFFTTAVAPTISGAPGDGVGVRNVHLVVNGAIRGMGVQIRGLVQTVLKHGCIGGKAALSRDRLLVRR